MRILRLGLSAALAAAALSAGEPVIVEQIIAKVNGDIITRSDLARARKELEASLRQRGRRRRASPRRWPRPKRTCCATRSTTCC